MNGASGPSDMHGNAARVAESEAGAERMKLLGTGGENVSVEPYMGHSQGRDNVKKRAARRKKTERLALAKNKKKAAK